VSDGNVRPVSFGWVKWEIKVQDQYGSSARPQHVDSYFIYSVATRQSVTAFAKISETRVLPHSSLEKIMLKLYIGNKNYSSWSMRPWVLLRQAGIAFEEVRLRFDSFAADSSFKQRVRQISPAGKVPVLVDGALAVWDTLAIAEYVAERFTDLHLWPRETAARACARSVCAEMHSGFGALRSACVMNIEARLPQAGAIIWRDQPAVRADVARIIEIWQQLLAEHGGPLLFGGFSIADAFYAPVVMRLRGYALPVPDDIAAYMQRVCDLPGVAAWIADALAERDFLPFEEPYRIRS
jgi:glutathione S-transferase